MEIDVINQVSEKEASVHLAAPGVLCMRIAFVNIFMIGEPGGTWVLVDAGLGGYANRIRSVAEEYFGVGVHPSAIVLTHGHFDHVGALQELLSFWNVPVYAHKLEAPYLTGRSSYPPPDPSVGGGLMSLMSWAYPNKPIDITANLEMISEGDTIPVMSEWQIIHTPGHTAGHISLFRESDRTLIAGDALTTVKQESAWAVYKQRQEMHGPPAYFTSDWFAARQSMIKLAALEPSVIAAGHGIPMRGEQMREQLDVLIEHYDSLVMPKHGRYVTHPARTDERGVVLLPPPVEIPAVKQTLIGLGVAALTAGIVYAILKGRRSKNRYEITGYRVEEDEDKELKYWVEIEFKNR